MKVSIKIPATLSEITLEQYQKYIKICEQNKDIENAEVFLELKMIEIFCYLPYSEVVNIKYTDIRGIVDHLNDLLNSKPDLVKGFELAGKKFGFVTNLDELTFDEMTTIDTNIGSFDTIQNAMAVLYRPIVTGTYNSKYIIEDYQIKKYWDVMRHMPLDAVMSSLIFFCHLGRELSKTTLRYLKSQASKEDFQLELNLVQNGIGITHFTDLLEATLQNME